MKKTVLDIIREVRVCMDEIGANDAEFMSEKDSTSLDAIIASKIVDALRFVHGNADVGMLLPDTVIATSDTNGLLQSDMSMHVALPGNFMRLCYARISSWAVPLCDYVLWTDKEYALLRDKYSTGTWERPKMAMALKASGRVLELYSAKDETDTCEAGFISEPEIADDGNEGYVTVSDKLGVAFIYYVTGLVLLTLKDEHADSMFNQATVLMGISPAGGNNETE